MTLPIKRMIHRQFENVGETMNFLNQNLLANHDYNSFSSSKIIIDFAKCSFIEPYHIAPLACIIHEYLKEDFRIEITGLNKSLQKYFSQSGFMDFCNGQYLETEFPAPLDKTTLPLWRISEGAHNLYPSFAENYYESHNFKGKDLQPLYSALGEMMNNIFDHSKCLIPGYTVTQFHPKRRQLYTCVCDLGCTIPYAINNFLNQSGKLTVSAPEAILKAMELGFSTLSQPHNRGFGLHTIGAIVDSLKGTFILASGSAAYKKSYDNDAEIFHLTDNFPGTMVVIALNTDNLQSKEQEMTDDLHIL